MYFSLSKSILSYPGPAVKLEACGLAAWGSYPRSGQQLALPVVAQPSVSITASASCRACNHN